MRLHAQDPTAYCAKFSAEIHAPTDDLVIEAEMTTRAATPDDSVLLHESSSPSYYDPMLLASSAAISASQDYDLDPILDDQAPPTQISIQESCAIPDAVLSTNCSDVSFLLPGAVEGASASIPETFGMELRPSLSRCTSPAPLSPMLQPASPCLSTVVPTLPSSLAPETAPQSPSVAPSSALEIHGTETLNEEAKANAPISYPERVLEAEIKRKEPGSEMKLPSPKRQRTETPVRAALKDKRMSASARDMAASRVKAMKKLATPFRSPLVAQSRNAGVASPQTPSGSTFKKPAAVTVSRLVKETTDTAVTSPFRPPMPKAPATSQPTVLTVQTLERRLQLLKRAIKIKDDGGDAELEKLALKWKNAARAASWDLWEVVKNGAGTPSEQPAQGSWNDNNWGWGDDDKKQVGSDGTWADRRSSESTGDHDVDMDSDVPEPEKADPSVGTMLAELGIAPLVLGWKEGRG